MINNTEFNQVKIIGKIIRVQQKSTVGIGL